MSESHAPSSVLVPGETDIETSEPTAAELDSAREAFLAAFPEFVKLCAFIKRKEMGYPTEPGPLLAFIVGQIRELKALQKTDEIKEEQLEQADVQVAELTRQVGELRQKLKEARRALEQAEPTITELRANLEALGQRFLDQSGPHHSAEESAEESVPEFVIMDAEHSHPSELSEEVEDDHFGPPVTNIARGGS